MQPPQQPENDTELASSVGNTSLEHLPNEYSA